MLLDMDWDAIIQAYPHDADQIMQAKDLAEHVDAEFDHLEIPDLGDCSEPIGAKQLIPIQPLSGACKTAWKNFYGNEPSWDIQGSLAKFFIEDALPDDIPEAQRDAAGIIIRAAVTGYLKRLLERNKNLLPENWNEGKCAFCSTYPRIAFDSETSRTMFCPLCGYSWEFPRIKCPFCNNTDFHTLGYFETDGIAHVRVYFCRECSCYIKAVDTHEYRAFDAETENVLSLEMDLLAKQEGFKENA